MQKKNGQRHNLPLPTIDIESFQPINQQPTSLHK